MSYEETPGVCTEIRPSTAEPLINEVQNNPDLELLKMEAMAGFVEFDEWLQENMPVIEEITPQETMTNPWMVLLNQSWCWGQSLIDFLNTDITKLFQNNVVPKYDLTGELLDKIKRLEGEYDVIQDKYFLLEKKNHLLKDQVDYRRVGLLSLQADYDELKVAHEELVRKYESLSRISASRKTNHLQKQQRQLDLIKKQVEDICYELSQLGREIPGTGYWGIGGIYQGKNRKKYRGLEAILAFLRDWRRAGSEVGSRK